MSKIILVSFASHEVERNLYLNVMMPGDCKKLMTAINALKAVNGYDVVAEIEYDERLNVLNNLEHAYKLMQNGVITDSWTLMPPDGLKPRVEPIVDNGQSYGHRSASMGDIFTVDGKEYVVARFGFEEVTD